MYAAHERSLRFQPILIQQRYDIQQLEDEQTDSIELLKARCEDLEELNQLLVTENNKLIEDNESMLITLRRLAALKKARDLTSIYIENFEEDDGYYEKHANDALDEFYINNIGQDWKLLFTDIKDQRSYYIRLVEDLNNQLLDLDLGPFN
mgnify:FL=1